MFNTKKNNNIIDLTNDDDDDKFDNAQAHREEDPDSEFEFQRQLEWAVAESRKVATEQDEDQQQSLLSAGPSSRLPGARGSESNAKKVNESGSGSRDGIGGSGGVSAGGGLAGLDRAAMERERLERVRKRKRDAGLVEDDDGHEGRARDEGRKKVRVDDDGGGISNSKGKATEDKIVKEENRRTGGGGKYWKPTVLKTFCKWFPDDGGLKWSEVIGEPSTLISCILSSYCLDLPWVLHHFPRPPNFQGFLTNLMTGRTVPKPTPDVGSSSRIFQNRNLNGNGNAQEKKRGNGELKYSDWNVFNQGRGSDIFLISHGASTSTSSSYSPITTLDRDEFPNHWDRLFSVTLDPGEAGHRTKPRTASMIGGEAEEEMGKGKQKDSGKTGRGSMHVKLGVFFHTTYCRISIPTANLMDFDWEVIENAVFVQDFPLAEPQPPPGSPPPVLPPFIDSLISILEGPLCVPRRFISHLRSGRYDFSSLQGPESPSLVWSLPGDAEGWKNIEKNRGGSVRLGKAIQEVGAGVPQTRIVKLECQGSSIGNYTREWMGAFHWFCDGHDPKTFTRQGHKAASRTWPPVEIIFPTQSIVENSIGGTEGGGTIFCNSKQWTGRNFPQHLFRRAFSKRPRVLGHTKMILGLHHAPSDEEKTATEGDRVRGFLYTGSHNLTPAAWGRFDFRINGQPGLNISNYELGIVLPLIAKNDTEAEGKANSLVTWRRGLQPYDDNDVPWMQFSQKSKGAKGPGKQDR